jgi:hypothetical protein
MLEVTLRIWARDRTTFLYLLNHENMLQYIITTAESSAPISYCSGLRQCSAKHKYPYHGKLRGYHFRY